MAEHTQTIRLSVFGHFVNLALKGLTRLNCKKEFWHKFFSATKWIRKFTNNNFIKPSVHKKIKLMLKILQHYSICCYIFKMRLVILLTLDTQFFLYSVQKKLPICVFRHFSHSAGFTGLDSVFICNRNTNQKNYASGLVLLSMKKAYTNWTISTQPAITHSKLTIETLEQGVKYVQS